MTFREFFGLKPSRKRYTEEERAALIKYSDLYVGVNPEQCATIRAAEGALPFYQQEYYQQASSTMPETYTGAIPMVESPVTSRGIPVSQLEAECFPDDVPIFLHYYWTSGEYHTAVNVGLSLDMETPDAVAIMVSGIHTMQQQASCADAEEKA